MALKIIKMGMDTKQLVGRFKVDRQALAIIDHPHVARVLDGSWATILRATDHGRPYFVMELVRSLFACKGSSRQGRPRMKATSRYQYATLN